MFPWNVVNSLLSLLLLPGLSLAIFNGQPTNIRKYPYMASMKYSGDVQGAGVILTDNWIMTTASNLAGYDIKAIEFEVGTNMDYDPSGQNRSIEKFILHPKWTGNKNKDYDVAVAKVSTPMKFGPKVSAVKLATQTLTAKQTPYALGWGQSSVMQCPSHKLLHCRVTVMDRKSCAQQLPSGYELSSNHICTFNTDGKGPCAFDVGAPLIIEGVVYALYSWSYNCWPGYDPLIYTDISKVQAWVQDAIKNN